jgi:hypothetical protein
VVPYQPTPDFGATIAGPIVKAIVDAFFASQSTSTSTTTTTVHK